MGKSRRDALEPAEERLRFFDEIGAEFLSRPESDAERHSHDSTVPRAAGRAGGAEELAAVSAEVQSCRKCPLSGTRTRAVPGEGNPFASLMFVGEAPGAEEDLQGRPFVGRAGRLLDKIIAAMGFDRGEVFIANILKCRPPNNRDPLPEEVRACSPYLLRQVESVSPEVIVALGKPSANFFSGREAAITVLRGRFFEFNGVKIMPTYHPAFLLRNEHFKKDVWQDMRLVMALLGKK